MQQKRISSLIINAEKIADVMYELAKWRKTHPNFKRYAETGGLIKLPPVFLSGLDQNDSYGNGKQNLIAMIKVLAEYEEGGIDGSYPTLSELPERYNKYGGMPNLSMTDMRRVHNWLQQVGFGVRAAILEIEERQPTQKPGWESLDVVDRTVRRLYANRNTRRNFITYASDNRYEYKPLRIRRAEHETIRNWVRQEYDQKHKGARACDYGARPTDDEWDLYGLKGQTRTLTATIAHQIEKVLQDAQEADLRGDVDVADEMDANLLHVCDNLTILSHQM